MFDFEFDPNYIPPLKLGLHIAQGVLAFVVWALGIAVFTADKSKIEGNNIWPFVVCFLTIPALVYLVMTPRTARTRRFAEPHAMFAVDAVFTVIWLSAFAAQAAYNSADDCGKACGESDAIVGLGVLIFLLFGGTTFLSGYTLQYYKFHNTLPGYDSRKIRGGGENIDPDKAAFSMAPHDDEAYERVHMDDHEHEASGGSGYGGYGGSGEGGSPYNSANDRYGNSGSPYAAEEEDASNPYGSVPPRHNNMFNSETGYSSQTYGGGSYDHDEPAQFPAGNYDKINR